MILVDIFHGILGVILDSRYCHVGRGAYRYINININTNMNIDIFIYIYIFIHIFIHIYIYTDNTIIQYADMGVSIFSLLDPMIFVLILMNYIWLTQLDWSKPGFGDGGSTWRVAWRDIRMVGW